MIGRRRGRAAAAPVVEEGRPGNAAVGDPHHAGAGVTGQLCGVQIPRSPRGGVVIEENSGVLGVDIAGVVTGGDRVEAIGALAFGIPALIAGVAVTRYGLHHTALVYLGVIAALAAAAESRMMARKHSAGQRARARRLTLTDTAKSLPAVRSDFGGHPEK